MTRGISVTEVPAAYDDEVDLRELLATLWRRKNLILGVTCAAVVLAFVVSTWVVTPAYESEVRFFLPNLGELGMTPDQYADYALSDGVLEPLLAVTNTASTFNDLRKRLSVRLITEKTVLVLSASAPSPEESQRLTSRWLKSFTEALHSYFSRKIDQALLEAEADVAAMRAGLDTLSEVFQLAPAQRQQALEVAATIAYGEAYSALQKRARLLELKASLADRVAPDVLLAPTLPQRPSSPRTLLNVVVTGVLGLMVGTFIALGLDWWQAIKPHEERQVA